MEISLAISKQLSLPVQVPNTNNQLICHGALSSPVPGTNNQVILSEALSSTMHIPSTNNTLVCHDTKQKVVVVMGATGTGKSRLSIDLATRFPAEIINSDKMQVYQGLDITTNKITEDEMRGVPHHLLGIIDPESDFSAAHFRDMASSSLKSIFSRNHLPIIVGGSNSFIEALVDESFQSKYECCFLWVDVAMPVLNSFVSDRVDKMVEKGMVNEVRDFYLPNGDYSKGIRRAIGVPELDKYFRVEPLYEEEIRHTILAESIDSIKVNTSLLAHRQLEKIHRLITVKGWRLHHLDATDVFTKYGEEADVEWENLVAGPSAEIVSRFLYNLEPVICATVPEIANSMIL